MRKHWQGLALAAGMALAAAMGGGGAAAQDRHEGYYYPELTSQERYGARATTQPAASRTLRIGFVTQLTKNQLAAPYPPAYAIYAKGAEAEKMIIIAQNDEIFRTLFRARGFLAQMTANARTTELFRNSNLEDYLTFLDLLKMLGFQRITISNGTDFAHQIYID